MKSILLFGGTFDPIHNGHTAMAVEALKETSASRLVAFPAGNPYQKGRLPMASGAHRKAMLNIAFEKNADVSIDTRELQRQGATFTVDTLHELRNELGDAARLIWLIGGDAFAMLDSWYQWQSLFTLANFAVVLRQGQPHPLLAASAVFKTYLAERHTSAPGLCDSAFGRYAILAAAVPPVSSTDIRARIAAHKSIRGLAPEGVCDYIEHHKLYEHEGRP